MTNSWPVEFETVPCNLCGGVEMRKLFSGPDRLLALPGEFTVVACRHCGLVQQNPRPTPHTIGTYYPANYEPYSIAIDDEPSRWRRWDRRYGMQKRLRAIARYKQGGRLLDVGCASGNFLHEIDRTGHWQAEGVEPNAEVADYARQRFGLKIYPGRLTALDLPDASYDVITLWNVLEHLHDPIENLMAAQRLLKPGGLLIFSIPNMESAEARWFGRYWLGWELPRHLYFFSRPIIEQTLLQQHLRVVSWDCLVGAYPSFLLTWRFAVEAVGGKAWWVRPALAIARALPMRLAMSPLFWLVTRFGKASLITGFARKQQV
jgi:SAM-dependent methyltransferase